MTRLNLYIREVLNSMLWSLFIGMLIFGAVLFVVSILLIFILRIPDIMDEISGKKAKRQIKQLKELNKNGVGMDMSTDDVYATMSSGSLLLDRVVQEDKAKEKGVEEKEEGKAETVVRGKVETGANDIENKVTSLEVGEVVEEVEENADEETPTSYLKEDDLETGFIGDVDSIEELEDVDDYDSYEEMVNFAVEETTEGVAEGVKDSVEGSEEPVEEVSEKVAEEVAEEVESEAEVEVEKVEKPEEVEETPEEPSEEEDEVATGELETSEGTDIKGIPEGNVEVTPEVEETTEDDEDTATSDLEESVEEEEVDDATTSLDEEEVSTGYIDEEEVPQPVENTELKIVIIEEQSSL